MLFRNHSIREMIGREMVKVASLHQARGRKLDDSQPKAKSKDHSFMVRSVLSVLCSMSQRLVLLIDRKVVESARETHPKR